jgi:hypothetical protein
LQRRPKWGERLPNLATGDVVLLKRADAHRNDWPLGRVVEAIKSDDGEVRKALVKARLDGYHQM